MKMKSTDFLMKKRFTLTLTLTPHAICKQKTIVVLTPKIILTVPTFARSLLAS